MTATEKEKYYDDVIAPQLMAIGKDATEKGLNFLGIVEWAPGYTGRTHCCIEGTQGITFRMANWAATCRGNVDSFWFAVQRYAMKYGHTSIFLKDQGIPSKPTEALDKAAATEPSDKPTKTVMITMV